jgi:cell division protein FtsQ
MTDPRIRERRVRVARESGRRRRHVLLGALALVLVIAGGFAILHSSLFGARHVEISGPAHAPYSDVVRVAGLEGAPPLVDLSTAVIARRVESLPWVRSATVSLAWPTTVHIAVTGRVPVALVATSSGGYAVVDPSGRVLEDVGTKPAGLPTIDVSSPVPPPGGSLRRAAATLARVAAAMPESMVTEVAGIGWGTLGIEVRLTSGLVAALGNDTLLTDKFVALKTVLTRADLRGIRTIDLRVPSAPVLNS